MNRRENIIFFIMLVAIFTSGIFTFIKTEGTVSMSENRPLATFDHFTLPTFLDGTFQDNFESALSDQFIFSEQIRLGFAKIKNSFSAPDIASVICKNHYLELANSVDRRRGTFDCDDYILYYPEPLTEDQAATVADNLQKYNHLNTLTDAYYYFINDSSVYDFTTNQKAIDYDALLAENLTGNYHLATLTPTDYADYKNYFYKTDHHWDYRGAYQGYLDILKLLNIESPLAPTGTFTNHEYFFGSHAQNTKNYDIEEEFTVYTFDIPEHSTIINSLPGTYGHYIDYLAHNYEYDKTTNYYAYFYGADEGEIIYDFHQPEKDNLLIISNSYSNAVNELIASRFNKTYVIDLRRYKTVFGQDFELSTYLAEHDIDKTLLIMSPTFIRETNTNQGLEL